MGKISAKNKNIKGTIKLSNLTFFRYFKQKVSKRTLPKINKKIRKPINPNSDKISRQ